MFDCVGEVAVRLSTDARRASLLPVVDDDRPLLRSRSAVSETPCVAPVVAVAAVPVVVVGETVELPTELRFEAFLSSEARPPPTIGDEREVGLAGTADTEGPVEALWPTLTPGPAPMATPVPAALCVVDDPAV